MAEKPLAVLRKKKDAGFTFLEIILVLSILSILTAIIIPIGNRWIRETSEEDAIKTLVTEIQSLQSYSLANGVYTKLDFRDLGRVYVSSASGGIEFSRTRLPEGMRVPDSSNLKDIWFQPDGDILKLGTITILTSSGILLSFNFSREG